MYNFLTLNKLKVPLCNLTLEPMQVRNRAGARRFLLVKWFLADHRWSAKSQPSSPQHRTKYDCSEQNAGLQVPLVCQKPDFCAVKHKPSAALGFLFQSFWLVRWISMGITTAMAGPVTPNPPSSRDPVSLLHSMGALEL